MSSKSSCSYFFAFKVKPPSISEPTCLTLSFTSSIPDSAENSATFLVIFCVVSLLLYPAPTLDIYGPFTTFSPLVCFPKPIPTFTEYPLLLPFTLSCTLIMSRLFTLPSISFVFTSTPTTFTSGLLLYIVFPFVIS